MSKTLYFEGAGCISAGEVANCRIRTAFTNDDGKKTETTKMRLVDAYFFGISQVVKSN